MSKYNRITDARTSSDPHAIANAEYNQQSGGKKTIPIGPVLLPLPLATPTCNATAAVGLPSIGKSIAVYNNNTSVGSITIGPKGVTVLTPGTVSGDGTQAGIPCAPNAWTYISLGSYQWFIASAATLLCYIVDDGSNLVLENQ